MRIAIKLAMLFVLSLSAFGQGAVLGAISFPSTAFKEWHFALMSGHELPVSGLEGWNYQHKTFTLATSRDLCSKGCTYTAKLTSKLAKIKLDAYCYVESVSLSGTFSEPVHGTTPNASAIYAQTFCTRGGFSLGGGDLTVEIP